MVAVMLRGDSLPGGVLTCLEGAEGAGVEDQGFDIGIGAQGLDLQQHDGVVVDVVRFLRGQGFAKRCAREREEMGEGWWLGFFLGLPNEPPLSLYRPRGKGGLPTS